MASKNVNFFLNRPVYAKLCTLTEYSYVAIQEIQIRVLRGKVFCTRTSYGPVTFCQDLDLTEK